MIRSRVLSQELGVESETRSLHRHRVPQKTRGSNHQDLTYASTERAKGGETLSKTDDTGAPGVIKIDYRINRPRAGSHHSARNSPRPDKRTGPRQRFPEETRSISSMSKHLFNTGKKLLGKNKSKTNILMKTMNFQYMPRTVDLAERVKASRFYNKVNEQLANQKVKGQHFIPILPLEATQPLPEKKPEKDEDQQMPSIDSNSQKQDSEDEKLSKSFDDKIMSKRVQRKLSNHSIEEKLVLLPKNQFLDSPKIKISKKERSERSISRYGRSRPGSSFNPNKTQASEVSSSSPSPSRVRMSEKKDLKIIAKRSLKKVIELPGFKFEKADKRKAKWQIHPAMKDQIFILAANQRDNYEMSLIKLKKALVRLSIVKRQEVDIQFGRRFEWLEPKWRYIIDPLDKIPSDTYSISNRGSESEDDLQAHKLEEEQNDPKNHDYTGDYGKVCPNHKETAMVYKGLEEASHGQIQRSLQHSIVNFKILQAVRKLVFEKYVFYKLEEKDSPVYWVNYRIPMAFLPEACKDYSNISTNLIIRTKKMRALFGQHAHEKNMKRTIDGEEPMSINNQPIQKILQKDTDMDYLSKAEDIKPDLRILNIKTHLRLFKKDIYSFDEEKYQDEELCENVQGALPRSMVSRASFMAEKNIDLQEIRAMAGTGSIAEKVMFLINHSLMPNKQYLIEKARKNVPEHTHIFEKHKYEEKVEFNEENERLGTIDSPSSAHFPKIVNLSPQNPISSGSSTLKNVFSVRKELQNEVKPKQVMLPSLESDSNINIDSHNPRPNLQETSMVEKSVTSLGMQKCVSSPLKKAPSPGPLKPQKKATAPFTSYLTPTYNRDHPSHASPSLQYPPSPVEIKRKADIRYRDSTLSRPLDSPGITHRGLNRQGSGAGQFFGGAQEGAGSGGNHSYSHAQGGGSSGRMGLDGSCDLNRYRVGFFVISEDFSEVSACGFVQFVL